MSAQTGALDVLAPARRPSKLADFLRLARTKTVGSAAAIILLLAFGLVLFMVCIAQTHRLARPQFRKQCFGKQFGVGADDVVGGLQYCTGGSVVLF